MSPSEVYETLNDIFRDVFDDPSLTVTSGMSAKDIPEWDSFNHINIVVATEQRFGIKFQTAEIDGLRTVGEFADLIARKRQAA